MTQKRIDWLTKNLPAPLQGDVRELSRIERGLHRWHEHECGTDRGCIERDETTGKPYWRNSLTMRRWPIRDMEASYRRRLARILARDDVKAAGLSVYVQTDPRGCALYVIRPGDVPADSTVDSCYSRGIPVC